MQKIEKSERIKDIEEKWKNPIKKLFYNWHWKDNLTHKEIGKKLHIPRCTITRWFGQFGVPSQNCQRMTKRRWQIRLVKTLKLIKKRKRRTDSPCLANKHFFKKWTAEMAYVLGYFAADGSMFVNPRGSHFIDFTSTDRELIEKVRRMMQSRHLLGIRKSNNSRWKTKYRLQIGSKEMFQDLLKLGLTPRKSKVIKMPPIPKEFLSSFVRGYFDGDGCVHYGFYNRKNRHKKQFILLTMFTSGSNEFLKDLWQGLKMVGLKGGSLKQKEKGFDLTFSINDSRRLHQFMYAGATQGEFLERKYNKFQEAFKIMRV